MPISINARLLVLALVPVLLLAAIMLFTIQDQTSEMVDRQVDLVENDVSEVKKAELKHIMEMAYNSIKHIYENGGAFEEALPILRNQGYGEDGYIFVYSDTGERLAMGTTTKGIGDNFWDLQDKLGNYLIRELLKSSKSGDGYFT